MRCPFQTVSITETIKAYAIGNPDFVRTTVSFQECLKDECPFYWHVSKKCSRVERKGDGANEYV